VDLPFAFKFYGQSYTQVFLGTNGYVTFGGGDSNYSANVGSFNAQLPRVAALFDDWLPQQVPTNGVYVNTQLPGRAVFTWRVVPQYGTGLTATFQAVLFANGRVQLGYNAVQTRGGLVGVTPGGAPDAQAVDFSAQSFSVDGATAPYEHFGGTGHLFDLERTYIGFTPTASGGYDVQVQPPSAGGDNAGPVVTAVSPAANATQVATDAPVTVTFNEPLDRTQDPRNVLKVYASAQPSAALAGDVTLDDSGQVLTFRPAAGFAESTRYTATVTGQMDAIGNIQFGIVNASFTTIDRTPPQVTSFQIAGQPAAEGMVVNSTKRPVIAVTYQDTSAIDTAATRLLFGPAGSAPAPVAATVNAGGLTYQPAADLAAGVYVAQASVADRWGNTATTDAVRFTVNTELPSITGVTPSEGTRYGQTEVVIRGLHLGNVAPGGGAASPGLRGDYFGNSYAWDQSTYFNTLLFSREDATVDFDWASGPPAPGAPEDLYMVRWTGQVEPRFSETYTFHAVTDDGVRLWVNGQQVIDHWVAQAPTESAGVITLEAGRKYDIRMEYYEQYGGAVARLLWSSPSQPKEVVPAERLSHPALSLPEVYVGGTRAVVTGGSFGSTDQLLVRTPGGPIGPADVEVRTDHGTATLRGGFNYLATPPQVVSVEPADNATQVSPTTKVTVTFDQPLDPEQDTSPLLRVSEYSCYYYCSSYPVVGTVTLDQAGTALTFTPVGRLNDSRSYFVEVGNVRSRDGMYGGNRSSYFTTADGTAPVIGPWTYNGQAVNGQTLPFSRPQLYLNIEEPGSGTNAASLVVTLDGQAVTSGVSFYGYALYFTPDEQLSNGAHTVTARVADNAGNVSQVSSATFTVSDVVQVTSLAPTSGSEQGGTVIRLRGTGLINSDGGQPTVLVGGRPATDDVDDEDCAYWRTAGACLAVRVPAGTPGPADVVVQTDHGVATVAGGFTYLADTRTRFEVEPDTALLWHFEWYDSYWDEDDNFPVPGYYTWDFGPYSLDVSDYWDSPSGFVTEGYPSRGVVGEGRFGDGVKDPALTAVEDYGVLGFGERGFTIEGWVRTDSARPLSRTHTVFGKENAQGQNTDYSLSLLPSGALRAQVFNSQGVAWEAATEATAGVADGAWHSLAMAVERGAAAAENRLVIYVDGVERASAQAPAGFGAVRDGGERFRAGHSDADADGYEKAAFPGWMDEVRVSSTAHTAERILHTYQGTALGLVALGATPGNVERDGAEHEVVVAGYNLRGVTASVTAADGSALPVTVSVTSSSATRATLVVTADPAAPLGEARLNLSAGGRAATLPFAVTSQHAFETEPGTVLLWHLDETSGYEVVDSGPNGINGLSVNYGWPQSGLFGYARGRRVSLAADADHAALAFGTSGFTVQTWVNANLRYEMGTFTLVGKQDGQGQNSDFELAMLPTGELRAQVYDTQGTVWEVKGPAAADWSWHLVSMVVERGAAAAENRLVIYVDGVERASAQAPAGFGAVRNTGNVIRAGNRDFDGPEDNTEWGPSDTFYGYLDDIHVLNYAQPAARVRGYWLGLTLAELGQASRGGARAGAAQTAAARLQPPPAAGVSTNAARALTPAATGVSAKPAARTSAAPKPIQTRRPPDARSAREGASRRADGGGFLKKRTLRAARG
ncbi:MAG TPA: Ig-like domain-containing protein, partial [Pyrinomonadaceae bacterium]